MGESSQRILVLTQDIGASHPKIAGIQRHGAGLVHLEVIEVAVPPELSPDTFIDDPDRYLPSRLDADLVLDFLRHPDLGDALAERCAGLGIPLVASGKHSRFPGTSTPPVCCALPRREDLGAYGRRFGVPEFVVTLIHGRVSDIQVKRGAPCGATWEAAPLVVGLDPETAASRLALELQYRCAASPASWDPVRGRSPLHLAADLHRAAFLRGLTGIR